MRPLKPTDTQALARFLERLTPETRRLSTFEGYDLTAAQGLCQSINRYDKLRFVIEPQSSKRIVGLLEFSFDIPETDYKRFGETGTQLDAETDCRFGPTLADDYQDRGLGSRVFPHIVEIARKFGKKRIILWGGVLKDNERAIHYYKKQGFALAGVFRDQKGREALDMIISLK